MKVNPKNPGSEKNLQRFGHELDAVEEGRKGGKAKTTAKKTAAIIRGLRYTSDPTAYINKKIIPLLQDPDLFAQYIITHLVDLTEMAERYNHPNLKAQIVKLQNETFKTIHGQRHDIKSTSINVNIAAEDIIERIKKYKEEETKDI